MLLIVSPDVPKGGRWRSRSEDCQSASLVRRRRSVRSPTNVSSAAPMAQSQPQVSALSPQGSGRNTALWQVVGPPSCDMQTVGQSATRTIVAAIHGMALRTCPR